MTEQELECLRYPIGKFNSPDIITEDHIKERIGKHHNHSPENNALVPGISGNPCTQWYPAHINIPGEIAENRLSPGPESGIGKYNNENNCSDQDKSGYIKNIHFHIEYSQQVG